jgi:DNA-binding NtrC family response regulator
MLTIARIAQLEHRQRHITVQYSYRRLFRPSDPDHGKQAESWEGRVGYRSMLSIALCWSGGIDQAVRSHLPGLLARKGVSIVTEIGQSDGFALVIFDRLCPQVLDEVRDAARQAMTLAIAIGPALPAPSATWAVLEAGASDLLLWPALLPASADEVSCRLLRWQSVQAQLDSEPVRRRVAGGSPAWLGLLRSVIDVARFTQSSVLITGETGTGKEQIAHLIHELDHRPDRGELVVLDCTTVAPELAGSEFFGHDRGAFTGASNAREGAFAQAHRGTLFLDEVGELSLPLQAQLLRVVQERQYKRLGSNSWQRSEFRLGCATHRDLEAAVAEGSFRADLYYRIAGWRCVTPPLRERREDILPLARFFLAQMHPQGREVPMDPAVREYLMQRDYPGNVRELRQVVTRLWQRHTGDGPLTVGDVPIPERPCGQRQTERSLSPSLEAAIRHVIEQGIGLKEIGQIASNLAMQIVLEQEDGNLQRAATRLGVTDRALQIRRAQQRETH